MPTLKKIKLNKDSKIAQIELRSGSKEIAIFKLFFNKSLFAVTAVSANAVHFIDGFSLPAIKEKCTLKIESDTKNATAFVNVLY